LILDKRIGLGTKDWSYKKGLVLEEWTGLRRRGWS